MFRIFLALALLLTSGIAWSQQGPKQATPQSEPMTSDPFKGTPEEQDRQWFEQCYRGDSQRQLTAFHFGCSPTHWAM